MRKRMTIYLLILNNFISSMFHSRKVDSFETTAPSLAELGNQLAKHRQS